jgi:hypothetical protein
MEAEWRTTVDRQNRCSPHGQALKTRQKQKRKDSSCPVFSASAASRGQRFAASGDCGCHHPVAGRVSQALVITFSDRLCA